MPSEATPLRLVVSEQDGRPRLDAFLANKLSEHSRAHVQRLIAAGKARVDGQPGKAATRLQEGQVIELVLEDLPSVAPEPEHIPLDILFEDQWLAAVNKPAIWRPNLS